MPRLQPKPKNRRKVPIPSDLRDAMREAFEMIREAKRDPDVMIDFGDAIQVGSICGGQVGTKLRPFVFTYYPEDDERGKWYLTLHRTEVEDIGDGRITDITMYCCTSPDCRIKAREEDHYCSYCDYVEDTRHDRERAAAPDGPQSRFADDRSRSASEDVRWDST